MITITITTIVAFVSTITIAIQVGNIKARVGNGIWVGMNREHTGVL